MSELDTLTGDNSTLYTPSTRRVRAAYVHGVGGSTWYEGKAEALRESFDRWLTEITKAERERIRANIIDRVQDLTSCHKNDNCQEFGALIASYVEEWIDEEEE